MQVSTKDLLNEISKKLPIFPLPHSHLYLPGGVLLHPDPQEGPDVV